MPISELIGKAQTVLGPVTAEDLGITLPHEHLLVDMSFNFVEPATSSQKALAYQPVGLENLSWIHYHVANNLDNLRLWDEELATNEVLHYKRAGGRTIVDVTTIGIGRDPLALQRIACATGLNIIMGAGYYLGRSYPAELDSKNEEEITEDIVREITLGTNGTVVRAGIIGEISCWSCPLTGVERKVLSAAARAQQRTGAPINIHPAYHNEASPLEIIEVLEVSGADLSRTVFSHIDVTLTNAESLRKVAEVGCYLEYDIFGRHGFLYHPTKLVDIPSEGQRVDAIKQLIEQGYLHQILISQDVCTKMRLLRYGGHGYAHILHNIVPVMRTKGVSEDHIQTILVENAKRLLPFV
jgi:phosphotriesterase-related protein